MSSGALLKGQKGLKGPRLTIFVIETSFLASRLNVTKENSKKNIFENFCFL